MTPQALLKAESPQKYNDINSEYGFKIFIVGFEGGARRRSRRGKGGEVHLHPHVSNHFLRL